MLEIGVGTGRNLKYLLDAVGRAGFVLGVDAAPGMLSEARRLIARNGWTKVRLVEQDAETLDLDSEVDAVLFSLSYSAIPNPRQALDPAWSLLRAGGRVVVMDAGLTATRATTRAESFDGPAAQTRPGGPLLSPLGRPYSLRRSTHRALHDEHLLHLPRREDVVATAALRGMFRVTFDRDRTKRRDRDRRLGARRRRTLLSGVVPRRIVRHARGGRSRLLAETLVGCSRVLLIVTHVGPLGGVTG